MSVPVNKSSASVVPVKEEGSQQSQPMDLAPKSNPNLPVGSTVTAIPTRFVGESPAGIFLVRPTGSPIPVISLPTPPVTTTSTATIAAAQVHPGPVTVTVPMPITVARFQATIRPGTTVTIAPRVGPAPLVTSTTGSYAGQPSHVPKGAAAVASIAIPRSVIGAAATAIRPVPSTNSAISQVTGFSVTNRANRPNTVSVRPAAALDTVTAAGSISGAWVTVTPTVATSTQPPPVPTLYKATTEAAGVKNLTGPTNLIITAQPTNKPAPILTPAPIPGSAVSIIGQPKVSAVPGSTTGITLLSVRGPNPSVTQRSINTPSSVMVGPRPSTEVIKTAPPLMPQGPQQLQRTPSMTITSTSNVQNVEKHFVKNVSNVLPSTSIPTSSARNLPAGPIQIAARTLPPVVSSSLTANNSLNSGALKNIAPVVSATGKVGQPGIAVQLPQMSVSAVTTSKVGGSPHTHVVAGIRPVTSSTGTPPVGGSNVAVGGARTYLVNTTQAALPSTNVIPVAKVLPQPVIVTAGGGVGPPVIAAGVAPSRGINQKQSVVVAASGPLPNPAGFLLLPADSTVTSVVVAPTTSSGESNPLTAYGHAPPRPALHASGESTIISSNTGGPISATTAPQPHPPSSHPNTPSKFLGSSPRPSILRKRDYEGAPLKAQKNLTTSLSNPATSTPSAGTASAVLPTTPAISPSSPRRLDLGSNTGSGVGALTPGGPNGDSSRSSSGGSTTLSASSSPGIPPDNEEPPSNISSPAAVLDKALSNIQVKQEALQNAETSRAIASLMRMSSSASVHLSNPSEVQMSPRKKPRKQQLLGQELQEVRSSDDEMPASLPLKDLKHENSVKSEPKEVTTVVKRPRVSLISTYRQSWKARNHHFTRYSDVKLKDERRPTVTDLANQKQVLQKVHGWKVFHLSAQIEEMAHSESQIHERLSVVLEVMEKLGVGKNSDRDLMRVNELIKGNLQRSKVIRDGLEDSKNQVQKIFDHKPRAEDIIQRYMYKRLAKKREKL